MWSRVRSRNALSPHSQGPQSPKLGRVLNQDEGVSLKKSRDISIVWSHKNQKSHISSTTGPTRCISKAKINTKKPTGTKNAEMK